MKKHSSFVLMAIFIMTISTTFAATPNNMENRADHANEYKNATQGTPDSESDTRKGKDRTKQLKPHRKNATQAVNGKDERTSTPDPK